MLKKLGMFFMIGVVLLLVGNRIYEVTKEPEITDSFSIQTSASPNQANTIEIKQMYAEQEEGLHADSEYMFQSLRIYYGKYGRTLKDFEEIKEINMPAADHFQVKWMNDEKAHIHVMHKNDEGESFVFATYQLDLENRKLIKQTV